MKLKLENLKLQSFVTADAKTTAIKGGVADTFKATFCAAPGGCSFYCPSGFEC